jgi:site-specific recombinase XerD
MIKVPEALQKKYNLLLMNSDIAQDQYGHCKKWLRYYLDFCKKYSHAYADPKSLLMFLEKLREKNQAPFHQAQAKMAVELYYSGIKKSGTPSESPISLHKIHEGIKRFESKAVDDPWLIAVNSIKNEIELRHYSKKTLKAYTLWAEKLRYFTNSKLPESLTPEDVKEFLTFLAVKKKVSASSQNQAFNALLFFFRHVLKKEFGKIEGVVRAKRKPYIPVVLSREEIDLILQNLQYPFDLVVKLLYGCVKTGEDTSR